MRSWTVVAMSAGVRSGGLLSALSVLFLSKASDRMQDRTGLVEAGGRRLGL